jgi:hypothetical protein
MAYRAASSLIVAVMLATFGCNSLLGTESGHAAPKGGTDGGGPTASPGGDPQTGDPGATGGDPSGPGARTDTKPPCQMCDPELVVQLSGEVREVRRAGNFVYVADDNDVYRLDGKATGCKAADATCKKQIVYGGFPNFAVNNSVVCWQNARKFGCADVADLSKSTEIDSAPPEITDTLMRFDGDYLYDLTQGSTLVRGRGSAIADKTSSFGPVSEPSAKVRTFALSAKNVAWTEEQSGLAVKVTPLSGGKVTSIPLPSNIADDYHYIGDVALYDKYVYVAPLGGNAIYRAPIDGSEEATKLVEFDQTRYVAVNASGIYVAFGSDDNGAIGWSPLDPSAQGAPAKKVVATTSNDISTIDVGDDGIYYGSTYSVPPAVWRIKFE